ncbi:clavesin-2 isoform X2 [Podarcis raffonei]|uniref:clavesin-2 isoform X2 n=1 Tax=Podarcis raffonei TaxID=65483 RepID=UPI00232921B1|nr:clavesin-2 isoform X2 [Podarcis raffonei]
MPEGAALPCVALQPALLVRITWLFPFRPGCLSSGGWLFCCEATESCLVLRLCLSSRGAGRVVGRKGPGGYFCLRRPGSEREGHATVLLVVDEITVYTLVDILRAILLSLEAMIEDPELQVNGFVLIIDWSNFTFKQASKLTPSMLRLAIEGLQDSFPARFGGIHFVNQPWYIHALYTVIRPFLKEKTRKRIFLHGNNLNSLHQLIHPEILPSEFGGMLPPYDMGTWARTLLDHEYDDDSEYSVDSYNTSAKEVEKDLSPKSMKRSQSVVDPGVLKRMDKNEEENMQPLLSLD